MLLLTADRNSRLGISHAAPSPEMFFVLCDPVTLTFGPLTHKVITLVGYPKVIPYTKFEHSEIDY